MFGADRSSGGGGREGAGEGAGAPDDDGTAVDLEPAKRPAGAKRRKSAIERRLGSGGGKRPKS